MDLEQLQIVVEDLVLFKAKHQEFKNRIDKLSNDLKELGAPAVVD
jgi:hypothetical protein